MIYFLCSYNRQFVQTVVQDSQLETKINMSLPLTMVIHGYVDSTNSILLRINNMGKYSINDQVLSVVLAQVILFFVLRFSIE